jgi:hypothetical protein
VRAEMAELAAATWSRRFPGEPVPADVPASASARTLDRSRPRPSRATPGRRRPDVPSTRRAPSRWRPGLTDVPPAERLTVAEVPPVPAGHRRRVHQPGAAAGAGGGLHLLPRAGPGRVGRRAGPLVPARVQPGAAALARDPRGLPGPLRAARARLAAPAARPAAPGAAGVRGGLGGLHRTGRRRRRVRRRRHLGGVGRRLPLHPAQARAADRDQRPARRGAARRRAHRRRRAAC